MKPLHVRRSHARDEIRIFAQRLLDTAPARVARDVEHGRQCVVRADRPHLRLDDRRHLLHDLRVPRAGDADRLREARRAQRHVAAAALFVHHRRDAQARIVDQPLLDGVRQPRAIRRAQVARPADARDLADAMRHQTSGFWLGEGKAVQQLEHPGAAKLADFFRDAHLGEQVADALVGRPGRIFV